MALDCFFAVWFVVGNVWIFGGHSSSSEAPNLYRYENIYLAIDCVHRTYFLLNVLELFAIFPHTGCA